MQRCVSCLCLRSENSFYTDGSFPKGQCKVCIHRPHKQRKNRILAENQQKDREQKAILHIVQETQRHNEPMIYLIEEHPHYKVGTSRNVYRRVRQFETSSSQPVRLIAVAPGGRPAERELHERYAHLRVKGEWFLDPLKILLKEFAIIEYSMVFVKGYVTQEAPLAHV